MSEITKPIMLDDTGKEIAGKLEQIASAIQPKGLNNLTDVELTNTVIGESLMYNGEKFVNADLMKPVSDRYNTATTYGVGSYCIYNNRLWRCKTQCKGVTPTSGSDWVEVTLASELSSTNSNLDKIFYKDNFTINDRAMLVFPNSSSCYIISLGNFSKTNATISSLQVYTGSGWVDMNLSSAVIKTVSGFITIENITKLSSANLNAIYPCRFVATLT